MICYYDSSGRIDEVYPATGTISYFPFGVATSWTEDNGAYCAPALDQDGRVYWSRKLGASVPDRVLCASARSQALRTSCGLSPPCG
jgi:hypothetical protein